MLHLTVNSTYAPMEYRDPATNELVGLDIDLANEVAKRLGVKIVWSETPFAELIPSLQTKRADFIISGISDRASRRETADFIDYLTTGPQFFVLAESTAKAATDLCGKKVGTTRSTSFPVEIEKWSKQNCETSGKPAVQFVPGENSIDVRNQLKQGRIDAAVQGSETLPYAQAQEAREIPYRRRAVLHRLSRHHVPEGRRGAPRGRDAASHGDDRRRLLQGHSRQIRSGRERGDTSR